MKFSLIKSIEVTPKIKASIFSVRDARYVMVRILVNNKTFEKFMALAEAEEELLLLSKLVPFETGG